MSCNLAMCSRTLDDGTSRSQMDLVSVTASGPLPMESIAEGGSNHLGLQGLGPQKARTRRSCHHRRRDK